MTMTPMLVTLRDIRRGLIATYVVLGVEDSDDGRKRALNAAKEEHGHARAIDDPVQAFAVTEPVAFRLAGYIADPHAAATRR